MAWIAQGFICISPAMYSPHFWHGVFYYIRRPSGLVSWISYAYQPLSNLIQLTYYLNSLQYTYIYQFHLLEKAFGSSPPEHNFLNSGLAQLGYFAIYSTQTFLYFITQPKGPEFNSCSKHLLQILFHPPFSPQFISIHLYILHPHSPLPNNNVLGSIPTLIKHQEGHYWRIQPSTGTLKLSITTTSTYFVNQAAHLEHILYHVNKSCQAYLGGLVFW